MKTKDLIKYFISCGAIIYTLFSALILSLSLLLSNAPEYSFIAPKPFLLLLGYAYIISLGNTLLKIEKLSVTARRLINFSCYVIGFFAFIMLSGVKFAVSAVSSVIFAIFYIIIVLVTSAVRNKNNKEPKLKHQKSTDTPKTSSNKKSTDNAYQNRFS